MAELDNNGKYDQYYEDALGDHLEIDPKMRERLRRAQKSIALSTVLDQFPFDIHPMRAPKIVGLLGVHSHDFKEVLQLGRNWNVLGGVDFSRRNLVTVDNDSILALAALTYEQAGIFTPNGNPHPYLSEVEHADRPAHVTERVTTTRILLGESPLAAMLLDPVKRETRRKNGDNGSSTTTKISTQTAEQTTEIIIRPDDELIPGLNAEYFANPRRTALLREARVSDLMRSIEEEAQRRLTFRDATQIPAQYRWLLMYLANTGEFDRAQTEGRPVRLYGIGDQVPAPIAATLAENLHRNVQQKIAAAEANGKKIKDKDQPLIKLLEGTVNKRRKSGKPI